MSDRLLKYIPKTLQEDFVENRVVPFVGAGFSKNAIAPAGTTILDWDGLGRAVASYILIKSNITPVTLDEVIMRGNLWTRKADLLIYVYC